MSHRCAGNGADQVWRKPADLEAGRGFGGAWVRRLDATRVSIPMMHLSGKSAYYKVTYIGIVKLRVVDQPKKHS